MKKAVVLHLNCNILYCNSKIFLFIKIMLNELMLN